MNYTQILSTIPGGKVTLVVVSKTQPVEKIMEVYEAGQREFGENRVQELLEKKDKIPADIRWHVIGHLQRNKVKYIAPFVYLIHSVDSMALLEEVNKCALNNGRVIDVLLEVFIASEETKFGLSEAEVIELLENKKYQTLKNIRICGLMGIASNTPDQEKVRAEFATLKALFDKVKNKYFANDNAFNTLSMGMSSDYKIAMEEGSTMVRIGSAVFV